MSPSSPEIKKKKKKNPSARNSINWAVPGLLKSINGSPSGKTELLKDT